MELSHVWLAQLSVGRVVPHLQTHTPPGSDAFDFFQLAVGNVVLSPVRMGDQCLECERVREVCRAEMEAKEAEEKVSSVKEKRLVGTYLVK